MIAHSPVRIHRKQIIQGTAPKANSQYHSMIWIMWEIRFLKCDHCVKPFADVEDNLDSMKTTNCHRWYQCYRCRFSRFSYSSCEQMLQNVTKFRQFNDRMIDAISNQALEFRNFFSSILSDSSYSPSTMLTKQITIIVMNTKIVLVKMNTSMISKYETGGNDARDLECCVDNVNNGVTPSDNRAEIATGNWPNPKWYPLNEEIEISFEWIVIFEFPINFICRNDNDQTCKNICVDQIVSHASFQHKNNFQTGVLFIKVSGKIGVLLFL